MIEKRPKVVRCLFSDHNGVFDCRVDEGGWGRCGDEIMNADGELCLWAEEVLEWEEVKP